MSQNYDESEGVWRTVGGRRIFIKSGQSLADAMKESGKFKKGTKAEIDKKNVPYAKNNEGGIDDNSSAFADEAINHWKKENEKYKKQYGKDDEMAQSFIKRWEEEKKYREKGEQELSNIENKRTTEQINKEYEELSKKMQQDDYYYNPEDDRKLKELRAEYDTEVAKGQKDVNLEAYNKREAEKTKELNKQADEYATSDLKSPRYLEQELSDKIKEDTFNNALEQDYAHATTRELKNASVSLANERKELEEKMNRDDYEYNSKDEEKLKRLKAEEKYVDKKIGGDNYGDHFVEGANRDNQFSTGEKVLYNGNEVEIMQTHKDPRYGNEYLVRGDEGNVWVTDNSLSKISSPNNTKSTNDDIGSQIKQSIHNANLGEETKNLKDRKITTSQLENYKKEYDEVQKQIDKNWDIIRTESSRKATGTAYNAEKLEKARKEFDDLGARKNELGSIINLHTIDDNAGKTMNKTVKEVNSNNQSDYISSLKNIDYDKFIEKYNKTHPVSNVYKHEFENEHFQRGFEKALKMAENSSMEDKGWQKQFLEQRENYREQARNDAMLRRVSMSARYNAEDSNNRNKESKGFESGFTLLNQFRDDMAKEKPSMNDKLRNEAYKKYMKEHPNSKMTKDEFLKKK